MNSLSALTDDAAKLLDLETYLRGRIRGQDHVMPRIVSILQRGQLGLTKPNRPRGSFLFLGPTGVGKTETALAFTTHLFGEGRLFRFHPKLGARPMRDAVEKLVGDAVAVDLLTSGTGNGLLLVDEPGNCLVVRPAAAPVHSAEEHSQV